MAHQCVFFKWVLSRIVDFSFLIPPSEAEHCKECEHEDKHHLKERPAEEVTARLVQQDKEEREKIDCKLFCVLRLFTLQT